MGRPARATTSEQLQARKRWLDRWNLPILLAALVPLFVTSPKTHWVQVAVGLGSWLVFVVDRSCSDGSCPTRRSSIGSGTTRFGLRARRLSRRARRWCGVFTRRRCGLGRRRRPVRRGSVVWSVKIRRE